MVHASIDVREHLVQPQSQLHSFAVVRLVSETDPDRFLNMVVEFHTYKHRLLKNWNGLNQQYQFNKMNSKTLNIKTSSCCMYRSLPIEGKT